MTRSDINQNRQNLTFRGSEIVSEYVCTTRFDSTRRSDTVNMIILHAGDTTSSFSTAGHLISSPAPSDHLDQVIVFQLSECGTAEIVRKLDSVLVQGLVDVGLGAVEEFCREPRANDVGAVISIDIRGYIF